MKLLHEERFDTFGQRLQELRKTRYKTQDAFAVAIGKTVESVRNWEQGRLLPEPRTLVKIAELLDCDLDYLFGKIDCRTHDLQLIHEYTGLSESALQILHEWKDAPLSPLTFVLNRLIESDSFKPVLSSIWNYFHCLSRGSKRTEHPFDHNVTVITGKPTDTEIQSVMVSKNFDHCIDELSKLCQN